MKITDAKVRALRGKVEMSIAKVEQARGVNRTLSSGDYRAADEHKVRKLREVDSSLKEAILMLEDAVTKLKGVVG